MITKAVKQASKIANKHSNVSPKLKELQKGKKQKRSTNDIPISLTVAFPLVLKIGAHDDIDSLLEKFQDLFNYKKIKSFEVGHDINGFWINCFYLNKKPSKKEIKNLLIEKNFKLWEDEEDEEDEEYPIEKDIEYDLDEDDMDEY